VTQLTIMFLQVYRFYGALYFTNKQTWENI